MGRLEKIFEKFWWTRGVAAAIALTAIGSKLLDLKQHDFLKLFHALIVGWDSVASWIGKIVSIVILFSIGPTTVNVLVVCLATLWPYYFIRILGAVKDGKPVPGRMKGIFLTSLIPIVVTLALVYASVLVDRTAIQISNSLDSLTEATWDILAEYETQEGIDSETKQNFEKEIVTCFSSKMAFSCVYETADDLHDFVHEYLQGNDITEESVKANDQILNRSQLNFLSLTSFVLLVGTIYFLACCYVSKLFRQGAYHVFVFLITVEVLYLLPVVGDYLSNAADTVLNPA